MTEDNRTPEQKEFDHPSLELTPQEKLLRLQEMGKMPKDDFSKTDLSVYVPFVIIDPKIVGKIDQILREVQEIKSLLQTQPKPKMRFPQTCLHCGSSWDSRVEHPVQCPSCHGDMRRKPKFPVAAVKPEDEEKEFTEACAKFDALIKEKGKVVRELNSSPKKRWVFTFVNMPIDSIHYQKFEIPDFSDVNTPPVEDKVVVSTYEILKNWEWRDFLFDTKYGEKLW